MLRAAWDMAPPPGLRILWSGRGPGADLPWDIVNGTVDLPKACLILHLAAVMRGSPDQMALNPEMAARVAAAAVACGSRLVLMASTAAIYGARGTACDEQEPPLPFSPYGQAKLAAESALFMAAGSVPATALRIGNVVGADALLGAAGPAPVVLDPVPGHPGGPVRSWIGPQLLARLIAGLTAQAVLPSRLNIATAPPLPMAALLQAAGKAWHYGPPNPAVLPRAVLDTALLHRLIPLPPTTPAALIADWRGLRLATS